MCFKKYLTLLIRRTILHLKGMGLLFWIPVAMVYGLIPLIAVLTCRKYGISGEFVTNVIQFSLLLIPLFSCWWAIFLLREYLEGDGNEILYVCRAKGKGADVLFTFIVYFVGVLIQYSVYIALMPRMALEVVRLLCISLFYLGLSYFLMFLTRSTAVTVMAVLVYTVGNYLSAGLTAETFFPFYFDAGFTTLHTLGAVCLPMLVCGLVLFAGGVQMNRRALRFN